MKAETCVVEGCTKPVKSRPRQMCGMHLERVRRNGTVNDIRPSVAERFAAGYRVAPVSGCWEWTGVPGSAGYGHIHVNGKIWGAHRLSYELHIGPIPAGLQIDHLCRNRICVNPDHLEAVTHAVNTLRGMGPAALNARKTHCIHGHEFTAEDVRPTGGRDCRTCSRERDRRRWGGARRAPAVDDEAVTP